jgi:hypothetical protein
MAVEITLTKAKLLADFEERFVSYYNALGVNKTYTDKKWRDWEGDPDIVVYHAVNDSGTIGWIVFNQNNSTIEEFLPAKGWDEKGMEALMLDALVIKESLVSAEILQEDSEKYQWLVDYGFRPTRHFRRHGFSFVGMELSTSVYLSKVRGRGPIKPYSDQEQVVVEKVPAAGSPGEIKTALMNVLDALGGVERYVGKGQAVVIKPNVVADHGLRDGVYHGGVVTDIRLLKALLEVLLPVAGSITIAEGSSINRAETMQLFKHYGYDKLVDLEPEKVRLVDLHKDDLIEKRVPRGKRGCDYQYAGYENTFCSPGIAEH